jgi:glycosyltransferase involved in cell wall biosynthesis
MTRKGLLFVSPIMPDDHGNGLAMRAGVAMRALSRRFNVHLAVVPVAGGPDAPTPLAQQCAVTIRWLPLADHLDPYFGLIQSIIDPKARQRAALAYPKPYLSRFCTGESASVVEGWRKALDIAALYVMRLYLAPLVGTLDTSFRVLDLDEDDVTTFHRIAQIHRRSGASALAEWETAEAAKYATLMSGCLKRFHRVLVSSAVDGDRVQDRVCEAVISVVPNAAPCASGQIRVGGGPNEPLRIIFVGNLGYSPNADAAVHFCRDILPRMRAVLNRPVVANIAGAGAPAALVNVAAESNVNLLGSVSDLALLYAHSDLAVARLRAGGGTRIKILEAFAFRTPVVATSLAIEGIPANDGEHVLIADGPDAFARACLAVAAKPERAREMAERASWLIDDLYRVDRVEARLLSLYDA